jgi:hypothetical protein
VAFVDSDDAVFPEMYQVMLDGQMRRNSDVVCCGYLHKDKSYSLPEFFYVENQARGVYELEKGELFGLIWNKLYKKDILDKKNIRFSPGQFFGEDFLFNLKYFSAIYAILNIPHVLYKYNDNSESSITKTRPPFEQSHFRFTHVSTEIIKLKDTGNYIHMLLALDFSYTVFLIRNLYIPFLSPYRKRVEIISEIKGFYREHKAKTSFRGKKYFFFYRYLKVAPLLILDRTFRIFFLIVFKMRGYS